MNIALELWQSTGIANFTPGQAAMMPICMLLLYLGIKRGFEYGVTDDYCYNIVKDPVHIRDLNATILHQLGIDHEQLTFRYLGLDQRLTGVEEAHVVKDILV